MMQISEQKTEQIIVELKNGDVRSAIIAAAKRVVADDHLHRQIDDRFAPQVIEDGYGGFRVYFHRVEKDAAPLKKAG
jgi:hypothetical protein